MAAISNLFDIVVCPSRKIESFVIPGFQLNMPLSGSHREENDSLSSESNQQPGNSQQVTFIPPERCTAASAGPLPSFTPIHRRGRGREREGREEGGREGEDGALGPVPGRGRGGPRAGSSAVPGLEP